MPYQKADEGTQSLATKPKEDNSALESYSANVTITVIIVIVIAVSGYHLQAGASFPRHVISIIELSFGSLEFPGPDWGRGWGPMRKLTGRYIITGSRSNNRKRREGSQEESGRNWPTSWAARPTAPLETVPLATTAALPSAPPPTRAPAALFSLRLSNIYNPLPCLPGELVTNKAFKKWLKRLCCNALKL